MMKRDLSRILALVLLLNLFCPAFAAAGYRLGAEDGDSIQLVYLDPTYMVVTDTQRIFEGVEPGKASQASENGILKLEEKSFRSVSKNTDVGELPSGPEVPGWTFEGWYTSPVKYAFWGDTPDTGYEDVEPIPEDFKNDIAGNPVDTRADKSNPAELEKYWCWLSTLAGDGKKVESADDLAGVSTLYAHYVPKLYRNIKFDFKGWGGRDGVITAVRQHGTPVGIITNPPKWQGFTCDGWYEKGKDKPVEFYDLFSGDTTYELHWHRDDNKVTWENYTSVGFENVRSIAFKPGAGNTLYDGGTIRLHAKTPGVGSEVGNMTLEVVLTPKDCGVTQISWEISGNTDAVSLTVLDQESNPPAGGLRVTLSSTASVGTATVTATAKTADGKEIKASIIVDTGHQFDKTTVTGWGNCSVPTTTVEECVVCHTTQKKETYKSHTYAYREIPATCTTPKIWEHYCKVCGHVDAANNLERAPALGHEYQISTVSSCGGTVTTKTCTVCGYTETILDDTATHRWSDTYSIDVRPTCHTQGSKSIHCLDCGATKPDSSQEIPADPSLHEFGDWTLGKSEMSDDADEDVYIRTCSVCGQQELRAVPPEGLEIDKDKAMKEVTTDSSDEVADSDTANETIKETIDGLIKGEDTGALAGDILYAIVQEKPISTEVSVTTVERPEEAEKEQFDAAIQAGSTVVYMDIDILVKAGDESIGRLTETDQPITFQVPHPGGGQYVKVLRSHDGVVEPVESRVEGDTIYFTSDKFSTYAVVVSDTPDPTPGDPSGSGSSSGDPSGSGSSSGDPSDGGGSSSGDPSDSGGSSGGSPSSGGSSGGSSSGSGSSGTAQPAKPDTDADSNAVQADVTGDSVTESMKEARENGKTEVVLTPEGAEEASQLTVTVPKESVSEIGDAAMELVVESKMGTVRLPADSLKELAEKDGAQVGVTMEQKADGAVRIGLNVGGTEVDQLQGGLTVNLAAEPGTVLVIVHPDGTETVVKKSAADGGTIKAILNGSCTVKAVDNSRTFDDVNGSSWYGDAVAFVSSHELFQGVSGKEFAPEASMSRAMFATVLCRLEDARASGSGTLFQDVGAESWYSGSVAWASEMGIVQGSGDGSFHPDKSISREELVTMLYRYAQKTGLDTTLAGDLGSFSDGDSVSSYAANAMIWAVQNGLIRGAGAGRLNPGGTATRAEVAQICERLIETMIL